MKAIARDRHLSMGESQVMEDVGTQGILAIDCQNLVKENVVTKANGEQGSQKRKIQASILFFENQVNFERIKKIVIVTIRIEILRKAFNIIPQCKVPHSGLYHG